MKMQNIIRNTVCLLGLFFCVGANAKGRVDIIIIQPDANGKNYIESDSVKFTFLWEGLSLDEVTNKELYFQLENKLDERIYIEWENARTNGSRVILGDDSKLTYMNKKEDEAVSAKSLSIKRSFFKESNAMFGAINGWAERIWGNSYNLPKVGDSYIEFLIPVRFPDGKTIDYKFKVDVKYQNTADVSVVKVGMKEKDVKKLIGSPNSKTKDKASKTEYWTYTNNAKIVFVDDKVTRVELQNE